MQVAVLQSQTLNKMLSRRFDLDLVILILRTWMKNEEVFCH
ncbi:hypothetical protein SynMVIR181_01683 [Synechococcus sp. MVIR-18-1]|nr:hypothetical protein SynMVIR181_01683 [Synechococcus sp. MVIR-18-1]